MATKNTDRCIVCSAVAEAAHFVRFAIRRMRTPFVWISPHFSVLLLQLLCARTYRMEARNRVVVKYRTQSANQTFLRLASHIYVFERIDRMIVQFTPHHSGPVRSSLVYRIKIYPFGVAILHPFKYREH